MPRKIVMLTAHFFPVVGGAECQVQRLSKHLLTAYDDLQITVLTRRHSSRLPPGLTAAEMVDGVPVVRMGSWAWPLKKFGSLFYAINALLYLLRHARGGIYHAHDEFASGQIAVMAKFLFGGRALVKLRSGRAFYERQLRHGRWRTWWFYRVLKWADRVLVVNQEVAALLRENGIAPERITYLPNSIDLDDFQPATAQQRQDARKALDLSPRTRAFLYVGRLEYWKGVDVLIAAWAQLPPAFIEQTRLIIVGDGPDYAALTTQIRKAGVGGSVQMVGEQRDVITYYQAADGVVIPSRTEGLSNVMVEAMACGLPVLASAVGGALDTIQPGENGFLFPAEDATALACSLQNLAQDATVLGAAARKTAEQQFDIARTGELFRQIYVQTS
jgi:glycosyltransferase involved in cell wall biosynthesis